MAVSSPIAAALFLFAAATDPVDTPDYAGDARALDQMILDYYAYPEHLPEGRLPDSAKLAEERAAVHDHRSLLAYAERRIASLADHHAITGASFADSWAVVPTYGDLWISPDGSHYRVEAVRPGSPAAKAGIAVGDRLIAVDGVPVDRAIASYWEAMGLSADGGVRAGYAARMLVAGRRDRDRDLSFARGGREWRVKLTSLYALPAEDHASPVSVTREANGAYAIRYHNSLGDNAAIAAFDAALATVPADAPVVIDLRDTPSGGNTTVARGAMGWFVNQPTAYQIHNLPSEKRETGIERQWVEQVLPRVQAVRPKPVAVRVGRWTGSMGEGMAIGFAAMGVPVCGDRMAGLLGAIYDFPLPSSGMVVKFPAERLYSVNGQPREEFQPIPAGKCPVPFPGE
ncbi:S41 family peptidase [Sphingopyxis sp. MWB1]|uniref:S41 family peptidase n=1 Tax=Sphingopyxis sp. MWB1 TaxID=1537715 RepID=UPI00068E7015|nr:PDZ domain-containing protein [Sphingopyxis sp. MWB1]